MNRNLHLDLRDRLLAIISDRSGTVTTDDLVSRMREVNALFPSHVTTELSELVRTNKIATVTSHRNGRAITTWRRTTRE